MIKVKLGKNGGYVVGDGPCPFNPDKFMSLFMDRLMEAKRAGLNEVGFTDEEVNEMKQRQQEEFNAVPVTEIPEAKTAKTNKARIFAMLDAVYNIPPLFEQHV
jgi:hypothetical protein